MLKVLLKALWEIIGESNIVIIFVVLLLGISLGVLAGTQDTGSDDFTEIKSNRKETIISESRPIFEEKEEPIYVSIPSVGISSVIVNPKSNSIDILDAALQKGAVRYPGSALLGENANMLLFGHSSSLPVVRNRAYKTFNNLGKLKVGDEVKVRSSNKEYVYRVIAVSHKKDSEAIIKFTTGKKMLTLSTCNNFGKKQDRFIVDAEFIKSFIIS